ncbi:MAG: SPOR domain-containing protein [Erythrobacter sp.]
MMKHRSNLNRTISAARLFALAGAGSLALASAPAAADVKAGVDAWSQGNFSQAVTEWQLPAEKGDADALFNLAQAYRLGRGVPTDIGRARTLYAEAAQKGHVKAADNYGLLLFQQGEQRTAMPLIKAAADRGDPRAQYVLGLAHFNADYAEKDWVRAYALLTLAQSAGLPQAQKAISQMDRHVPIAQRQSAQALARDLELRANSRRSAELASLDLGQLTPVASSPARAPAVATPTPRPVRTVPTSSRPAANPSRSGNWKVQLGAFGVRANADRLWSKVSSTNALSGTSKVLVPAGRVVRLQAKGFNSRAEAQSACNALKRQGQGCIVAKP